jgi:hypothetical protein
MGGMQQGFSMMNLPSQLSGQQNVPSNIFSGGNTSPMFGGYNANNANANVSPFSNFTPQGAQPQGYPSANAQMPPWLSQGGGGTQPWMNQMMQGGSPQMSSGYGIPGSQQGNGLNPSSINPGSILQQVAAGQGPGAAVSTLPAWQQGVQAQQYNIQQGADNLAEQFNNAGGLFSNAYGSAAGQYQTQATLGENAQLSQSMLQAQEQAQGIQAGAAMQLPGLQLQSLGLGSELGGQQYSTQQNTDTANYTNWLNSQPYSNPYLSMAYGASTTYPPQTYQPGWLTSLLGGAGMAASGAGSILQGLP